MCDQSRASSLVPSQLPCVVQTVPVWNQISGAPNDVVPVTACSMAWRFTEGSRTKSQDKLNHSLISTQDGAVRQDAHRVRAAVVVHVDGARAREGVAGFG